MFFNFRLSICFLIVSVFSAMISYFIHCEHTFLHVHKYSYDSYFKSFANFNICVILGLFTIVFSFYLGSCSIYLRISDFRIGSWTLWTALILLCFAEEY